jgi:hypothetical protein
MAARERAPTRVGDKVRIAVRDIPPLSVPLAVQNAYPSTYQTEIISCDVLQLDRQGNLTVESVHGWRFKIHHSKLQNAPATAPAAQQIDQGLDLGYEEEDRADRDEQLVAVDGPREVMTEDARVQHRSLTADDKPQRCGMKCQRLTKSIFECGMPICSPGTGRPCYHDHLVEILLRKEPAQRKRKILSPINN